MDFRPPSRLFEEIRLCKRFRISHGLIEVLPIERGTSLPCHDAQFPAGLSVDAEKSE